MNPRALACILFAMGTASAAWSMTAAQMQAERERIGSERARVEAEFARREKDCGRRFFVNSCMEDARRDHRHAVRELQAQEAVLDETDRQQRAAERLGEIEKRNASQAARPTQPATTRPVRSNSGPPVPAPNVHLRDRAASTPASQAGVNDERSRRVAEHERQLREAKEHRDAVNRRNAERAASGKPRGAPLPVPGAASAASR